MREKLGWSGHVQFTSQRNDLRDAEKKRDKNSPNIIWNEAARKNLIFVKWNERKNFI